MEKIKYYYKNNSNHYQLVGNDHEVIAEGNLEEMIAELEKINVATSRWCVVEIIAPGEAVEGVYLRDQEVIDLLTSVPVFDINELFLDID